MMPSQTVPCSRSLLSHTRIILWCRRIRDHVHNKEGPVPVAGVGCPSVLAPRAVVFKDCCDGKRTPLVLVTMAGTVKAPCDVCCCGEATPNEQYMELASNPNTL